jgi:hypothetical protein
MPIARGGLHHLRYQCGAEHEQRTLKNQTVGLGGNAAFVTEGTLRMPQAGVAYKCPSRSGAGS